MLQNFTTKLGEKTQLTSNVWKFKFSLVDPKTIDFKAGQYLILKIKDQCRLYSICSPDFIKDYFELVVEIVPGGLGSTYLDNLKVGDSVNFQGPAGLFTIKNSNLNKIFLATGTGIAPTRNMIYSNIKHQTSNIKYYLFWGLKTRNDVCFFDELKKLAQENVNFQFKICLSREKDLVGLDSRYFMLGHINDGLMRSFEVILGSDPLKGPTLLNSYQYYICGGRDMVSSMVTFLQEQGIKKENIFFEKF